VTQIFFLQAFHREQVYAVIDVFTHLWWYANHLPPLLSLAHNLPAEQVGAPLIISIVPFTFWSLSIEEYFYLLWAPVVLRFSKTTIVCAGTAVCVVEMTLRWVLAAPNVYFGALFRLDVLLYGAFLALLIEHWNRTSIPRWARESLSVILGCAVVGITAIVFAIRPVLGNDPRPSPLVLALGLPLLSLLFTALIGLLILRSDSDWWLCRVLRTSAFQFVGTISYTMYLVHLIAATIVRHLFREPDPFRQTFVQAVLSAIFTIVIAQLSWIFLEKKALEWKDKRFPNAPHPPEPQVRPIFGRSSWL